MQPSKQVLRAIPASDWVTFLPEYKEALLSVGCVPINDIFIPLWRNTNKINLLYGSYGSGKSVFACAELVRCCLETKYFKCYYGRKVFDTVRGSVFATLTDTIEDLKLTKYFTYSKADNSSMIIHCTNGNTFIPFGADKAEKLKSIKDPTHFFCDEFDQFEDNEEQPEKGDFALLYPRLRTTRADLQFYGSFNNMAVLPDHWIVRLFFPEMYDGKEITDIDMISSLNVDKLFSIYTDNLFINHEEYYQKLVMSSGGNKRILDGMANGAWGMKELVNPWLFAIDPDKHFRPVKHIEGLPVYLSFDFNNDPFVCVAYQFHDNKGSSYSFLHYIHEFSGLYKVKDMCDRIKATFSSSIFFVTGDRSGSNDDIGRNNTIYEMVQNELELNNKQMRIPTHNLEHNDSRQLCNTMLTNYPNMYINDKLCPNLARQMQKAIVDGDNVKPGHLKKDRKDYKNDEFDAFRYSLQTDFLDFARTRYLKFKSSWQ